MQTNPESNPSALGARSGIAPIHALQEPLNR